MFKKNDISNNFNVEQLELKGFSRSVAEIEWLLLLLVILYYVSPGARILNPPGVVLSMMAFAAFTLGFRYFNFFTMPARWKIAIETWAMILFLTWVVWNTGKVESPLLNLYLLVIIASALTLGRLTTFLEFMLISAVYFYLDYYVHVGGIFSMADFSNFMTKFGPFLLIAYVTTMLAADVQYGKDLFKHLSETDELTGLLNKRSFNAILLKEIKKAERYSHTFSLLLIDADNLKEINDRYGHEAGDRLIKMLAGTMQECLRTSDILARNGGDEFIALLPETDSRHARDASERIRSAIENTSFDMNGNCITSSVSIGIAGYPEDAVDFNDLIERVDKALYMSKKAGRNRVSLYSERNKHGNNMQKEDARRNAVTSI